MYKGNECWKKVDDAVKGVTFDDLLLVPGYSEVLPADVDVSSRLGHINLSIPLMSAAMDTVTEKEFAAAFARLGGFPIIHKGKALSYIPRRAKHIEWVKRRESGVIYNPVTLHPEATVGEAKNLMYGQGISGIPVVIDDDIIIGMLTDRDVRHVSDLSMKVKDRMTERDKLVTIDFVAGRQPKFYVDEAQARMDAARVEKIPIVEGSRLEGLITQADIDKVKKYPDACRDSQGRLMTGVAVGVSPKEIEGVETLLRAGADAICVDTAHGHSKGVIDAVKAINAEFKGKYDFVLVAGNVATYEGAKALIDAGVDAVKVGIGPGSICTTRMVSGVGIPQMTAISNAVHAAHDSGKDITVIADGGVKYSGDVSKCCAVVPLVMIGSLLAGHDETPGDIVMWQGRQWKEYRGMGSLGAMEHEGGRDRYGQGDVKEQKKLVPEGIEGRVPYRGSVASTVHQLIGGLRAGMGYVGAADLQELREKAQFIKVSQATAQESHVHGVMISKEAPNYSQR